MPSLTSFVLIGLAFAGAVNAEDCSTDSLISLASNANLANCTEETGISVSTMSTLTQDQIMSACDSESCIAFMSSITSLGLDDCTIPGSNVSVQSDLLDSVATMCGGSGSMGSMAGSSSSMGSTNVGDSSSSSDKLSGGSSSSSESGAATVTISCVSTIAVAVVAMLL